MDYFISGVSEEELRKERARAREIRHSSWWKRKLAECRCYYCGREFPVQELTMDHIVPIIRGGKSTKGNMVTACKECNNKKKHMLPIEWGEYLHALRKEEDLE
jgi:5-methylcytosine-specific restriction endonuclease McrA